jgi:hypothetical protein
MGKSGYIMEIVQINTDIICLPKRALDVGRLAAGEIRELAQELRDDCWPKGKELVVKDIGGRYEVHASLCWYRAAVLSGLNTIPCVIY